MNAHRKEVAPEMPQDAPRRGQPNHCSPSLITASTYHLLGSLRPAPPLAPLKGRVSSHNSEEAGGGFSKCEQFIFRLILLSASPSCPGLPGANNSFLSHDSVGQVPPFNPKPTAGRRHTCVSVSTQVPGE